VDNRSPLLRTLLPRSDTTSGLLSRTFRYVYSGGPDGGMNIHQQDPLRYSDFAYHVRPLFLLDESKGPESAGPIP
jgi:hypothetical protein